MEAVLGEGKTRTRAESNQESSSSIEDDETECSSEPSALKEEQSYPSSQTTEDDNVCVHGKPFASSFVSKRKMEAAMLGEVKTRTRAESNQESSSSSIQDDDTECRSEPSASQEEQCHPSSPTTEDESPVLSIPSLASTESGDTTSSPTSTNTIDSCSSKEHSCHEEPPRLWEAEDGLPANRFQNHSKRLFKSHSLPRRSKGVDVEFFVPPINQHHALLKKQKKKTKRERKTAVGAVGGMVGGFFVLGPFGVILGAAMGGYVTRKVAKKAEKWSQRRKEQESVQNYATSKSLQWKFNDDSVMLT